MRFDFLTPAGLQRLNASTRFPLPGCCRYRSPTGVVRWILAVLALATGCRNPDQRATPAATTLTVSAAASLQDALQQIARQYEAAHPDVRLRLNFASSGTLQQQIQLGAPVDIFVSAAEAQVDVLQAQGLIDPSTRASIAANQLVLIVPAGAPEAVGTFEDLASPRVRRIAIGAPASVPAGRYAQEVLRTLGIEQRVMAKTLLGQHVRQVLTYVARGEVDAGIVYRTDAAGRPEVRIVASAPAGSHSPIGYPMAVTTRSPHPSAARAFAEYLVGAEAQAVLRRFGFAPP